MASLPTGAVLDVTEVLPADQQPQHQQQLVPFRSFGVNLIILQTNNFYLQHTTNTIRQLKVKINSFWSQHCPEKRLLYLNSVGKLLKAKLSRTKQVLHLKRYKICQVRKKYHNFFCTRVQSCDPTFTAVKKGSFSMTKLYLEMTVLGYCIPSCLLDASDCRMLLAKKKKLTASAQPCSQDGLQTAALRLNMENSLQIVPPLKIQLR